MNTVECRKDKVDEECSFRLLPSIVNYVKGVNSHESRIHTNDT